MNKLFFLIFALLVSACATVFSGSTQTMHVQLQDNASGETISGAKCTIKNSKGAWSFISSPNSVITITKGGGALTPNCIKRGYTQSQYSLGETFNKTTLINVLFWPGFLVDMASGSMNEYPSHMVIYMHKN